jgi:hypothetical protein
MGRAAGLAGLLILGCFPVPSAAATLTGRVLEEAKGTPIADAVVYVHVPAQSGPGLPPGIPGFRTPRPAVLDQVDVQFMPRVLVVGVGTTVHFPNSDNIHHNIYSFSRTKKFDLGLFKGQGGSITFNKPGEVKIYCNIHPEMGALILVTHHALFGTTDAEGRFRIANIPPGRHVLRAVHVLSRGTMQPIEVGGDDLSLELRLKLGTLKYSPFSILPE